MDLGVSYASAHLPQHIEADIRHLAEIGCTEVLFALQENHIYTLFHQWVPSASRMHHALRWGLLATAAVAALSAGGMDRIAARRPGLAWGLVAAGVLWTATMGSWPLSLSVFPGVAERAMHTCSELWLTPIEPEREAPTRVPDERSMLDGVYWKTSLPITYDVHEGWSPLTTEEEAKGVRIQATLDAMLTGFPSPHAVPAGACVLVDAGISLLPAQQIDARLRAIGASHEILEIPARTFHGQDTPRRWDLYRLPESTP